MKADQLDKMAQIYETFPALVKTSKDPSQLPRCDIKYVALRFRECAETVRREQWMGKTRH